MSTKTRAARKVRAEPPPEDQPVIRRAYLPRKYSAKSLIEVARWFRRYPDAIGVVDDYAGSEFTAQQWFAWFREKLMQKINASDPQYGEGRKWGDEYQLELERLRGYIGTKIVIYYVPRCLGARVAAALADRRHDPDEF